MASVWDYTKKIEQLEKDKAELNKYIDSYTDTVLKERETATNFINEQQSTIKELATACNNAANTLEAIGEEDGFNGSYLQINKLRELASKHIKGD